MAPKVTGGARKELAIQAYNLHVKRWTYVEIAKKLDVSRQLVATLVKEEKEDVALQNDGSERALAIATYDETIRESFRRLKRRNTGVYQSCALCPV